MMKLWINRNSEISIREQFVTQIKLGIAAGDIAPGEKLPSTRALARRFGVHANTVSAAFKELAEQRVIEHRLGSGVFAIRREENGHDNYGLEHLLSDFVAEAARRGYSREQIKAAMKGWLSNRSRQKVAVIESDPDLRRILAEEIQEATRQRPIVVDPSNTKASVNLGSKVVFAALREGKANIPEQLDGLRTVFLKTNSVPRSMNVADKPADDEIVAVVSCWEPFLNLARIYLLAVNISPDALMIRSTHRRGWASGLGAASLIICDSATARRLPDDDRMRVFRLISNDSLTELNLALL